MNDLALRQAFLDKDFPVYCLGGKGIISFRMYPEGLKNLVEGWCKSFAIGSQSIHPLVMLMAILWISGIFTSTVALISSITAEEPVAIVFSGILYLLYAVQTAWFARRCGNFEWAVFLLYADIVFIFYSNISLFLVPGKCLAFFKMERS